MFISDMKVDVKIYGFEERWNVADNSVKRKLIV